LFNNGEAPGLLTSIGARKKISIERARKEGYFKKRSFSEGFSAPISTLEIPYKTPISE